MAKSFSFSASKIVRYSEVPKLLKKLDTLKKNATLSEKVKPYCQFSEECKCGEIEFTLSTDTNEELLKIDTLLFGSNS